MKNRRLEVLDAVSCLPGLDWRSQMITYLGNQSRSRITKRAPK